MIVVEPRNAALAAVSANPERPATAIVHDSDHARLVVFRIAPGQSVAPHRSTSAVHLSVLAGAGTISGERDGAPEERACTAGDVVLFAPQELHGMRAGDETLLVLATITPRPGTR